MHCEHDGLGASPAGHEEVVAGDGHEEVVHRGSGYLGCDAMHEMAVDVRWAELDAYRHVNHAAYLTYFETARIAALDAIGWGMTALAEAGMMILVAQLSVRFLAPAVEADRLTITTRVEEIRAASTCWHQCILRDATPLVTAEVVGAITNLEGRPRRLPTEFAKALRTLEAP